MSAPAPTVNGAEAVDPPQPPDRDSDDWEDLGDSEDSMDSEDSVDCVDSEYDSEEEEMFRKGKDPRLDPWTDTEESDSESEDSLAKSSRFEEETAVETSLQKVNLAETSHSLCVDDQEASCQSSPTSSWRTHEEKDVGPSLLAFRPARLPGPQHEAMSTKRPLDYFKLFFSDSIIATLVENTNAYGARRAQKLSETWTDVTTADMFSFISITLLMDLFKFPDVEDYWSDNRLLKCCFPCTVLSESKFLSVCHALHPSSSEMDGENRAAKRTPGHDPIGKIKPLCLQLAEACRANFQPDQNLCINEVMAAQEHNGISLERGHKVFALVDCATSYTWNLSVAECDGIPSADRALNYISVLELVDTEHLGSGYRLYLGKPHASPRLIRDLWAKGVGACGNIVKTKSGFTRTLENDLSSEDARGSLRWVRDGEILFVKWKDACEVSMCSTIHVAFSGETVRKRQKVEGKFVTVPVPLPPAVKDHGDHMRDASFFEILLERKSKLLKAKWYQMVFYHFLNVVVMNAYILYNQSPRKKRLSERRFLEMLIHQLVENRGGN